MAATTTNRALSSNASDNVAGLIITDIPDWTEKLRRSDTHFLNKIKRVPGPAMPMMKARWGWGSIDPMEDAINMAGNLSTTGTTMTVDNGAYFQIGHVLKVDAENMRVTGISGNDLTVVRAYNGDLVTGDAHLNDAPVYIIGIAMTENADDPLSPVTQGEDDFNYHSLYQMGFQFSNRARLTPTYESKGKPGDRFTQELKKKMQYTAPLTLNRNLLFGTRNLGSTSAASSFGGLAQSSYVTTRTSLTSNPLTEYDLLEFINTVWLLSGDLTSKTIMTSMFGKRVINSWYNGTRRSSPSDSKMSVTWDTISTDMGDFKIDVEYQFDKVSGEKDNLYLLDYDDFALRPYASSTGWQTGKRATDGPYDFGFLRGDWTMIAQNPDNRGQLHTWSTLVTDYPGLA